MTTIDAICYQYPELVNLLTFITFWDWNRLWGWPNPYWNHWSMTAVDLESYSKWTKLWLIWNLLKSFLKVIFFFTRKEKYLYFAFIIFFSFFLFFFWISSFIYNFCIYIYKICNISIHYMIVRIFCVYSFTHTFL